MREQSGYELLGVGEDASFEEIQQARSRLVEEYKDDRKQLEVIETAYDSVLMERLRLRQEGKIPVPDRIRFPERQLTDAPVKPAPATSVQTPDWLQGVLDTPSRTDILWPGGVMLATAVIGVMAPPAALAIGIGASIYFISRKERKFGRAVLITFLGFFGGVFLGSWLGGVLLTQGLSSIAPDVFATMVTLIALWLTSSFFR